MILSSQNFLITNYKILFLELVFLVSFLWLASGLLSLWTTSKATSLTSDKSSQGIAMPLAQDIDIKLGIGNSYGLKNIAKESITGSQNNSAKIPAVVVLNDECSLEFSIIPDRKDVLPGGEINYNIVARNIGSGRCSDTTFSLYYGDNEIFVSSDVKPYASNYYWKIGDLMSGDEYPLSLTIKHNINSDNMILSTEGCLTANNATGDACSTSTVLVSKDSTSSFNTTVVSKVVDVVKTMPVVVSTVIDAQIPLTDKEFGVWVWDSPMQMTQEKIANVLASVKTNGMNVIYVTIDDYLKIYSLPDGIDKTKKTQEYFVALNNIIVSAKKMNINIDVEGGWSDWAIPENRWKGYALIGFVDQYNKQYPNEKIHAFQYDVEPYLLPSYEKNKEKTLTDFVEFIDISTQKMKSIDSNFSIVIPHFYDYTQKWTPSLIYNDVRNYTFTHLLNILENKPGSTIIIMSYRNFFDGPGGTKELSLPEIAESSNGQHSTKVIIAQETGNVSPSYVTFYDYSKAEYFDVVKTIYVFFGGYSNFNGVATHYLDTFEKLK
ncbi:MAG: hypothetical protein AAB614_03025 [Patescibacteria group bacterium]